MKQLLQIRAVNEPDPERDFEAEFTAGNTYLAETAGAVPFLLVTLLGFWLGAGSQRNEHSLNELTRRL